MSHIDPRSEKSRRAILDAASGILARDRSASMSAIATATGIGRATLHRHFPTRNDLISAIAGGTWPAWKARTIHSRSARRRSRKAVAETYAGPWPALVLRCAQEATT